VVGAAPEEMVAPGAMGGTAFKASGPSPDHPWRALTPPRLPFTPDFRCLYVPGPTALLDWPPFMVFQPGPRRVRVAVVGVGRRGVRVDDGHGLAAAVVAGVSHSVCALKLAWRVAAWRVRVSTRH